VLFDGRDVTRATPQQRNIAQVFQFPVIYDTMTVAENLAFPLRNRKVPEAQIKQRVGEIAEMLEMSGQLEPARRRPGGRRQSRRSRWAVAWCARTCRRCCSTSR
jgi:ABC-type sugar transport system ATPase subunit